MSDRTTRELVVLIVAATLGVVLVLAGVSLLLVRLLYPYADLSDESEAFTHALSLLVGVVVGYISRGGAATRDERRRDR